VNRRRFLGLGAAAAALALAGCAGTRSDATHAAWLPAGEEGVHTAYIDLTLSERTSTIDPLLPLVVPPAEPDRAELVPDIPSFDRIDDPLIGFPLRTAGQIVGVSALSLAFAGLGDLVDLEDPTRGVTELFVANDAVVGTGDIDVASAEAALRSGTRGPVGENEFERVGEVGGYTYYEPAGDVSGSVAVSESAVLAGDTRAGVQAVIDARNGDGSRAVEENAVFDWLFETAGGGDVAVGWVGTVDLDGFYWGDRGPTEQSGLVSEADSVAASVTFAPDRDEVTAEFALRQPGLSPSRVDRLERRLGTSSDETSLSAGEDRVSVTGTYAAGPLDIDFVEPQTTRTTTVPGGADVPRAVETAVPPDAFGFEYTAATDRVRVNFRREFGAAEVTVRARESGHETSTTTPVGVTYLTVGVDPAGDEVVVIVTVDGESGVVARTTVP
jgi:hypothetical protein